MSENRYDYKDLTPFKWFVLENFPFIEADFDALTNWQLFCKLGKQMNKVIDSQNIVGNAVEEYTDKFIALKKFVDEFFANLDVQNEINNKLNEMAQSGELQEIVANYLNSKAIFGFDNVESMKNSTNLIEGSYAKTLGYYSKNDFGNGLYKIRSRNFNDNIDEGYLILLNNENLVAELIYEDYIKPEQFGAHGDNISDDSENIQNTFNFAYNKKLKVIFNKKYKVSQDIQLKRGVSIEGQTLNASIYGDNNKILIKGGTQSSLYVDNSDNSLISNLYFHKMTFVLGDTIQDFGDGITFRNCIFFGKNITTNGIIVKNNSWVFTIENCKIANYSNGILFAFTNEDQTRVLNSGAAIKIVNTDIYNCGKCVHVIGSALDGYNIMINNCDFEHSGYSIYAENGNGNNIQCNNLHIEGNTIGSIYSDRCNIYINNIWDFDNNPETYIAKYTAVNGGRIIIMSGRIAPNSDKLVKNIDSVIYFNLNQIVIPPLLYNTPILTDNSNRGIIVPDNYVVTIPNSISEKVYTSGQVSNLFTIEKGSNAGCKIEMNLRQKDSLDTENDVSLSVFMSSTTGTVGISIPLPKGNCFIHLEIEYYNHTLRIKRSYNIDNLTTSEVFEREVAITTDDISANKSIQLRYNYGIGTLTTNSLKATYLNGYPLVS